MDRNARWLFPPSTHRAVQGRRRTADEGRGGPRDDASSHVVLFFVTTPFFPRSVCMIRGSGPLSLSPFDSDALGI